MKKKRTLALLLALAVVIGAVSVSVFADIRQTVTAGDLNGDGKVTRADAQILLDYLTDGRGDVDTRLLDANGDGSVNNKDVAWLLRYAAQTDPDDPAYDPDLPVNPNNPDDPAVIYPVIYTLTFDANGGSVAIPTKSVIPGEAVGELPTPTRDYYRFDGWFTAKDGGTEITADTLAGDADATLYAHWTLMKFTLSFNANGGKVDPASKEVTLGEAVGTLPTPKKDYNNFSGWFTAAEGGEKITESTVMGAQDMTVYAHWTLKPTESKPDNQVPEGAQKIGEYWTYTKTENTESTSSSLSGWTRTGSYWKQTGSGSANYASFPYGFNQSNWIYTSFYKSNPYSAYNNGSTKREVSTSWAGYVYWHWMYSVQYHNTTERMISDRYGIFNVNGGSAGGYGFYYFYAFTSATAYPYLDNYYCCSRNQPSYYCHDAVWWAGHSTDDGIGTPRFFRFDYYTAYYTDYQMTYQYQKVTNNIRSDTKVTAGNGISNVQHYVIYRPI